MILFHITLKNYYKYFNNLNSVLYKFIYNDKKIESVKLTKKKFILISKQKKTADLSFNYALKKKLNYQFISRNFWHKFINNYWQETLFISTNNLLSDYYTNQLKSIGLLVYKGNQYKKFLSSFSKDLITGKIQVSLNKDDIQSDLFYINDNKYIKYTWRKGLNWYIYNLYYNYSLLIKYLLKNRNVTYIKKIQVNILPLFTIINQNNELITAEFSNQIFAYKNSFNPFKNLYEIIIAKKNHVGLLFINPNDALEYKKYSINKYVFFKKNLLKLFISQLSLYYKLIYSSIYNIEFRLVPDLQEVSNIIYKYQYYRNIKFDKFQKYGKTYFQGQPIYIIQPFQSKNLHTGQKNKLNYFYNINKNSNSSHCYAVFLNYKTALLAWNKFRKDYSYYKIPLRPNIYVSNLESFIKSKVYEKSNKDYVIIPSIDTYSLLFSKVGINKKWSIVKILQNQFFGLKNICQRLIWSLISKYPN